MRIEFLLLLGILAATPPATAPLANDAGGSGGGELRVMSFNVRYGTADDGENDWQHRRALFLRTIDAFGPDLLGTQELLAFQADELRDHLKNYGFAGVGRDDGKRKGEFSGLFFRADHFELLDSGNFWLSEHPDQVGSVSWDSALTRIASWVKLREKRDPQRAILWLNTHWDHRGNVARVESAKLVRRQIQRLRDKPDMAVIVTGDLNCDEDSEPYPILLGRDDAQFKLIDSYRQVHPDRSGDEASFHAFKGTTTGSRIDFILHADQLSTIDSSIDRTHDATGHYPSDHYPVTAILKPRH
jgi:endonuclease/exonuclease/phosphatase family metal-dependent hydrolase